MCNQKKGHSGKKTSNNKELTLEKESLYLKQQNAYLQQENSFFAGNTVFEKAGDAKGKIKSSLKYQIIQITAYPLGKEMTIQLVTDTIHILKNNQTYEIKENALFHSDQETQYTSGAVRTLLKEICIKQSMSRHGHCWDNTLQEPFYDHMKDELHLKNAGISMN